MDEQNITNTPNQKSTSLSRIIILLFFAFIIVIISSVITTYYLSSQLAQQSEPVQNILVPTIKPTSTITTDETAGWKTYTNIKYSFGIRYPDDWSYLEVPTAKYQTDYQGLWLNHSSLLPPPQTDTLSDIVFKLSKNDPSINWDSKYFNNYKSEDYQLGNVTAKKITGINKEGQMDESVIIAKLGSNYLQIQSNQSVTALKYFDKILSTFKFLDQNQATDNSISCQQDSDCILVDSSNLGNNISKMNCCGSNSCGTIDYSQNQWVAVNNKWFENRRQNFCPKGTYNCPLIPNCPVQEISNNYSAKCIQQTCQKTQNNIEGKACGGFSGEKGKFACPEDYMCQYPTPMYPDAQGKCVKK